MRISQVRFLLLIAACGWGCSTGPKTPEAPTRPEVEVDQALIDLNRILWIEDRRSDPNSELPALARSEQLEVRRMAMQALGRFPFPEFGQEITDELVHGLDDTNAEVRALAAFGLGLRADPSSAGAIRGALKDPDEKVIARLIEAAGHFEEPALRREVLYATDHASIKVRVQAVRATARWEPDADDAGVVDSTLVNVASRAPASLLVERWNYPQAAANKTQQEDLKVIWSTLFSLARRGSDRGREVYYLWCHANESAEARIFATRGLSTLEKLEEHEVVALHKCLEDEDWRVAVEAAKGLEKSSSPNTRIALEQALKTNANVHVQIAVLRTLSCFKDSKQTAQQAIREYLGHPTPVLRAQAVRSLAKLTGTDSLETLQSILEKEDNPVVLKALAQATEFLDPKDAIAILDRLVRHDSMSVAFAAGEGYGNFLADDGRAPALLLLKAKDYGLRLAGVLSLRKGPEIEDLGALVNCYHDSDQNNLGDEIRMEILGLVAEIEGERDGVFELLTEGLGSKRAYIQELAQDLLSKQFPEELAASKLKMRGVRRTGEVPQISRRNTKPTVKITTTQGVMSFELFPAEAPIHVHNFLALARKGDYKHLDFHRVVGNFVVQGADFRGDGNGARSWRGEPLRHEFNGHEYTRGSLGMPRNADPDSGGSQWFITHVPTPHLDGRYTLFGQLLSDVAKLDALQEGDTIIDVTVTGQ